MDNENKQRTSVIRKGLKRTLKTNEYESLVIEDAIEEIIEWTTLEERNKKADNWETILLQRFKVSHDKILDELGLAHKKAYFKNPSDATKKAFETVQSKPRLQKASQANLDSLDTLG